MGIITVIMKDIMIIVIKAQYTPSPSYNPHTLWKNSNHPSQPQPQNPPAPDKETLKTMLIEYLKKLTWDVEHVNPRTNKIMIDQSIETMQVAFRKRLKRKGILIDDKMIKMVCSEM